MKDLNTVILVGRLTQDAVLHYTQTGAVYLRFSIAVNENRKVNTQWQQVAHFFDVIFWGVQATNIKQYLLKGKQVALVGHLQQQCWDKDGVKQSKVIITADSVQLLDGGRKSCSSDEMDTMERIPF